MFYNEKLPLSEAKPVLKERRVKLTESQLRDLEELSNRIDVPASALVRMAVDVFLPKTKNQNFTEKGIKAGYINGNY